MIVLSGNTEILKQSKNGTSMTAVISNTTEDTIVEFPYIYYKGYTCTLEGKSIEVIESKNGMVSINLPKESQGNLQIKYTGTALLYISLAVSALTLVFFVFYIIYNKKIEEK